MSYLNSPQILRGIYQAPALELGDTAYCLFRGYRVEVTSWTSARIPWPCCIAVGGRGRSGLLVNEELARAVRSESVRSIIYWWGVSAVGVWRWRKSLHVTGRK